MTSHLTNLRHICSPTQLPPKPPNPQHSPQHFRYGGPGSGSTFAPISPHPIHQAAAGRGGMVNPTRWPAAAAVPKSTTGEIAAALSHFPSGPFQPLFPPPQMTSQARSLPPPLMNETDEKPALPARGEQRDSGIDVTTPTKNNSPGGASGVFRTTAAATMMSQTALVAEQALNCFTTEPAPVAAEQKGDVSAFGIAITSFVLSDGPKPTSQPLPSPATLLPVLSPPDGQTVTEDGLKGWHLAM